ncbi:MAG: hypothetical protein JXR95_01620 [Deltaproteobacteria bacterium]|nr:hypothetical protein [Deltaproteobacteria bacterium]
MNLVEVTLKRPGRIKSSFQIPPLMSHRMAVAPGPAKISVSFSSKEIPVILKEKKRYVVDIQKYF